MPVANDTLSDSDYDTMDAAPRSLPYTPIYQPPHIASSNSPPPRGFATNSPPTHALNSQLLQSFIAQRCADQLEQMQQPGMTDSIRAALMRPLPKGPPPKKPPRISMLAASATSTVCPACPAQARQQPSTSYSNSNKTNLCLNLTASSCGYNSE